MIAALAKQKLHTSNGVVIGDKMTMRHLGHHVGDRVRFNSKRRIDADTGTIIDIKVRDDLDKVEKIPTPLNLHYFVRWDHAQETAGLDYPYVWHELVSYMDNNDILKGML